MPSRATAKHSPLKRWFFFLLAGGTGFLMYLGVSNGLHYLLGVAAIISAIVGTLLPVLPTFWLQYHLTFDSDRAKHKALPGYALLQVGNAGLVGGLTALGSQLDVPAIVTFFVAGLIGVLVSYLIQARLIFNVKASK